MDHGYDTVCITNHLWDADVPGATEWYVPQNIAHVRQLLPLPDTDKVRLLFGCETEYGGSMQLALTREHFDLFDFVVIPLNHFHITHPDTAQHYSQEEIAEKFTTRLEELIRLDLPWKKIGIAHLTTRLSYETANNMHYRVFSLMPEDRLMPVFRFFAAHGTGIELNASCFPPGWEAYSDEALRLYRMAKSAGCSFYCCSDAHNMASLGKVITNLDAVISILGLEEHDRYLIP